MTPAAPIQPRQSLLARYRQQARALEPQSSEDIPVRAPGSPIEASEAQQQIWLHAQFASGVPLYNETVAIHFHGDLNVSAFERAFNEILRRHEAWRTSFEWRDNRLWQTVAPELTVKLPLTDLRNKRASDADRMAVELVSRDAIVPIDLSRAPLCRPHLVRLAEHEFRLYLCLHHLIFDGVSLYQVFLPELRACYSAFAKGEQPDLAPVTTQYPDWCLYQQRIQNREIPGNMRYWERQLGGGLPEMPLPLDRPRPTIRSFAGAMEPFCVSEHITRRLRTVGQQYSATSFMTYLAAFHVLLYHWTDATNQVIGSVTSTRKHEQTERALGFFLNTIVLRSELTPSETFAELLAKVRDVTLDALNNEMSFSSLVRRFSKSRKAGISPLFQVMFSLQPPLPVLGDGWDLKQMYVDTGASKFDLYLELDEREDGLLGRFTYSREVFDPATIATLGIKWSFLLRTIAEDPLQTVFQLYQKLSDTKNDVGVASGEHRQSWVQRAWADLLALGNGRHDR